MVGETKPLAHSLSGKFKFAGSRATFGSCPWGRTKPITSPPPEPPEPPVAVPAAASPPVEAEPPVAVPAAALPPVVALVPAPEPPVVVLVPAAVAALPDVLVAMPPLGGLGRALPLSEQPASSAAQDTKYRGNARNLTVLIPTPAALAPK